ncbi:bifunctional RNase H/acid phosphatase [Streptomyces sp. NPDC089424]|uniref:bifunctional RNase H/acid phosphatase n=1 Tax=Streptomyces sp. NPDC089424 TaxID=3365917 RepID=UPI0037F4A5E9
MREFIVEADGGSRGNPGPAGYGAVVLDAVTGRTLAETAEYLGVVTNNVAEYRGLLAGLRAAHALDPAATVHVRMDSKLVVEQMSGRWKIKHPDMKPLAMEAGRVFPAGRVSYEWIPRERNKQADRLANEAMDAGGRGEAWTPSPAGAVPGSPPAAAVPEPEGPPGDATAGAARARAALAGRATAPTAVTSTVEGVGPSSAPGQGVPPAAVAGRDTAPAAVAVASSVEGAGESSAAGQQVPPAAVAEPVAAAPRAVVPSVEGRAAGAAPTGAVASSAEEVGVSSTAGQGAWPVAVPVASSVAGREAMAPRSVASSNEGSEGSSGDVSSSPGASEAVDPVSGRSPDSTSVPADAEVNAARNVASPQAGWGAPDMGAPATFVLLRHGETPLTPQKRFSGSGGSDPSLSGIGREQAERVALALARRGTIQAVVASPLTRTRETAGIVAARLGLEVGVDDGLRETDFGAWEGLTFAEVHQRHPDDLSAWLASPDAEPTGGGESFAATATRIAATRDKLIAAYAGRTVLLVTHVTPIKTLVRLALGAPPESLFRMELSAASLSVVAYYADGNASVRLFNDTSHLR